MAGLIQHHPAIMAGLHPDPGKLDSASFTRFLCLFWRVNGDGLPYDAGIHYDSRFRRNHWHMGFGFRFFNDGIRECGNKPAKKLAPSHPFVIAHEYLLYLAINQKSRFYSKQRGVQKCG